MAAQDHAGLLAHWTEPDVRRFLFDGALLSSAEITKAIEDSARDFAAAGYGLWLIRETDGTDLVGMAGLRPLEDIGLEVFYSRVLYGEPDEAGRRQARPHDHAHASSQPTA